MTVGADTGQEGGAGTRCPLQMCTDGAEGEEPNLAVRGAWGNREETKALV